MSSQADRAAVVAVNEEFYRAFEAADLDAMRDLWVDDGETLCVHPGALPVRGTSAINRSWALIMANTPTSSSSSPTSRPACSGTSRR